MLLIRNYSACFNFLSMIYKKPGGLVLKNKFLSRRVILYTPPSTEAYPARLIEETHKKARPLPICHLLRACLSKFENERWSEIPYDKTGS